MLVHVLALFCYWQHRILLAESETMTRLDLERKYVNPVSVW